MSFSSADIVDVSITSHDADLRVTWTSTAAAGSVYQVYLNRRLAWHGAALACVLPNPGGVVRVDVGTVATTEASTDLSSTIPDPAGGGNRLRVTWVGGSFLGDVRWYRVYTGTVPGGAVSYTTPVATLAAYGAGIVQDGYGVGPYGGGTYGHPAVSYAWESGPLAPGTWHVGIVPVDSAGNAGTATETTATVSGPPGAPARNAAGERLTATVGSAGGSPNVTLTWLAASGV